MGASPASHHRTLSSATTRAEKGRRQPSSSRTPHTALTRPPRPRRPTTPAALCLLYSAALLLPSLAPSKTLRFSSKMRIAERRRMKRRRLSPSLSAALAAPQMPMARRRRKMPETTRKRRRRRRWKLPSPPIFSLPHQQPQRQRRAAPLQWLPPLR